MPVGVVGDIGSAIALAESLGLDPTGDVGPGHPRQVRHPVTYSHSTVRPMGAPPALGQHNDEIRAWLAPAGRPARAAGQAPSRAPGTPKETHREHAPAEASPDRPDGPRGHRRSADGRREGGARIRAPLCDKLVDPYVADWFERGEVDDIRGLAKFGSLGLLGMHLEGYGCAGMSATDYGLACLELEASDSGVRSLVSVQGSLAMYGIWRWGSEEQKQEWLPRPPARRSGASG